MDFIEMWFGMSPDGGDGTLETAWLAAFVVAVAAVGFRRQILRGVAAVLSRAR